MSDRTWSQIVDEKAKKLELAAMFNGKAQFDATASAWTASALRNMARILDRDAKDRGAVLTTIRFLGLKFTIARDG